MTAMYTPPDDVWALIHRLTQGTQEGAITWETVRSSMYSYQIGSGSVSFGSIDSDGTAPYRLTIYDAEGQTLETYEAPYEETALVYDRAFDRLFRAIRDSERGRTVSPVIESLLATLPKTGPIPSKREEPPRRASPPSDDLDDLPF